MQRAVWAVVAVAALGLTAVGRAEADVIVSNLTTATVGVDGSTITQAADEFQVGSQSESLKRVTLRMLGGTSINVFLYSNSGGIPGSSLLSLGTINATGTGFANSTLNAPSAWTLSANTDYWVVGFYNGSPGWAYTFDPSFIGSGSLVAGANDHVTPGVWTPFPLSDGPYQVRVVSAPVPEPSTLVLAGIGALTLAGYAWRWKAGRAQGQP